MEENSLTIAILREIRDNTARTNDRIDHLTDRVDALESLTSTMAAVQVSQAKQLSDVSETLRRLVDLSMRQEERLDRHEHLLGALVTEARRTNERIENLVEGAVATTVRDHEVRIRRLEGRDG